MMSNKRVILADGPRLLREMLHHVINRADHLEVVREVNNHQELPDAIKTFEPEWVILTTPFIDHSHSWIHEYPAVRFIFLSPNENFIKLKCQSSNEEKYEDLSLKDLIHLLEKDLQRT